MVSCSRDAPPGASAVFRAVIYLSLYLCSRQLRLMDVALGLGFKAGDMCSLSRSSGVCTAHVTRLGDWGHTRRLAGNWVCMLSLW